MEFLSIVVIIILIFMAQNILYEKYGMKNLDYKCYFSTNTAVEGDEIQLIEIITNNKILPLPWFKSEISTSKYLDFANSQSEITDQSRFVPSFFMLRSFSKVQRTWNVKCLKRGVFTIDTVPLVSTDLFGSKNLSMAVKINTSIVVFPKPFEYEDLNVSSNFFYGEIMVKRFILPDPFYTLGVREYTSVDTMNKINWKATAKQGKFMAFNNEYTSSQNVTVILNMQSHEDERAEVTNRNAMENSIRLCATLFSNTEKQNMPLKFMSNSNTTGGREYTESPEYFGVEHLYNLLHILSQLNLFATRAFGHYLEEIYPKVTSTDIIIITCFLSEQMLEFAHQKQLEGTHVKFLVTNYLPDNMLDKDGDIVCLAESFEKLVEKEEDNEEKS